MLNFLRRYNDYNDYLLLVVKIGLGLVLFLPLVVLSDFYFPFIAPRNLIFRFIIELIFFIYLYLVWFHKDLRPKFNKSFWFFVLLVLALTISSLLGQNFGFSFWSNFERMDGLANWLHLIMYLLVLLGVLQDKKDWRLFFNISLLAAWIVALIAWGQKLNLDFVIASSGDARLTATLGNAAYVGSYMMLHMILAFYLFLKKPRWPIRIFYSLSFVLFLFVLINTQTRGAFLGILLFVFLLAIFYLWFERKKRNKLYYIILSILIAGLVFLGSLFIQKDSAWVQQVPIFNKLTSISLSDITTQSRLMIWQSSLQGVAEKPILGWGEENFMYVFNKNFPIEIFHNLGSEIWFDRPHNVLIQHLAQGGIVGLALYLSIFIYLIIRLYKKYKVDKKWLFPFFWISFLISFLFHDLFIFDSLNTNVILYLMLGYLFVGDKSFKIFKNPKPTPKIIVVLFCTIVFLFVTNLFFIQPTKSNLLLVNTIRSFSLSTTDEQITESLEKWQKSWDLSLLGDREKVENLHRIALSTIARQNISIESKYQILTAAEQYLEVITQRYPNDVRTNLFLANFYFDFISLDPSFADKNLDLLNKMHALAPQRPDIYFHLTDAYLVQGNLVEAKRTAQELIELAPWVNGVYWNLMKVALAERDLILLDDVLTKLSNLNMSKIGQKFKADEIEKLDNIILQAQAQGLSDMVDIVESNIK